ncbi:MAG TPA: DUF2752 domain-containing protein [Ignavibacteria bacterium]|jgi:hypothetical protein
MPENKFFSVQSASQREARNIVLIAAGVTAIGLLSVYLKPTVFFFGLFSIPTVNGCPLLTFTGIPCPFCGMGRVFSCLTDLFIAQSFYYNPLGLVFYALLGLTLGYITFLAIRRKKIVFKKAGYKLIWIPVGFIILMWILNILYGHQH